MRFFSSFSIIVFFMISSLPNSRTVPVEQMEETTMNQPLRQLAYVSSAAEHTELSDSVLYDIAKSCQTRNSSLGVTGLLIYRDGNIWQILEGPSDAISDLFARISKDTRHRDIILIMDRLVDHRDFPFWNFAFRNYSFTHLLQARLNHDERQYCTDEQLKQFDDLMIHNRFFQDESHPMSKQVANLIKTFQRTILRYEPHQRRNASDNIWSRPTLSRSSTQKSI